MDASEKPKKSKDAVKPTNKSSKAAFGPSTIVSSPAQGAAKRRARAVAPDDDDSDHDFEIMGPHQHKRAKSYVQNDFIVPDDEMQDSVGFAPIREGASRKRRAPAAKPISDPITSDRLDSLEPSHRRTVLEFQVEAKAMCTKFVNKKGLKRPPFTETNLIDMAILFPKSKDDMLNFIADMDQNKVEAYGDDFLKLIKKYAKINDDRRRASLQDRPVYDKNRDIVDLVDDEVESLRPDDSGEEEQEPQRSDYFSQVDHRPDNPRVAAWNNTVAQQSQHAAPPTKYGFEGASRGKKPSSTWKGQGRGGRRKGSGSSRSDAGVEKSRKPSSGLSRRGSTSNSMGARSGSRQPSMGAGGQRKLAPKTGGIGMMPI